jgi:predicted dehydrogenase
MTPIRLMTLAPGHFHAALVQKHMPPGVHRRCHVYAPLDSDFIAHLERLAGFNGRAEQPTSWEVDARVGADYLDRFLREQPGNTVVISGRNRPKIDLIKIAVENNLHVLADKPWIVEAADLPKLEAVLLDADDRDVLVWDVMTERHEVTNRLQWQLIRDKEVFGGWQGGSPGHPALTFESVHHLKKLVSGRPLHRPWWWFDPAVSGEAMADVGTHLADLALRVIAPDRSIDPSEVSVLAADRWPLVLDVDQFRELTGLPDYPPELAGRAVEGQLYYAGNNTVAFVVRGVHVRLGTRWEYEAAGGDTHESTARGTRATVSVRQEAGPGRLPQVSVVATDPEDHPAIVEVLRKRCADWAVVRFPGVAVEDRATEAGFVIPPELRAGHEEHFAAVMAEFVGMLNRTRPIPACEVVNAMTKYTITTRAVELARTARGTI